MGGESGLGMISSLKNNAALLRGKGGFGKPVNFAKIRGSYLKQAGSFDQLKKASPKELTAIRNRIKKSARIQTIKAIIATLLVGIGLVVLFAQLVK